MPFIILDRDGVINYDSAAYIKSPEEWLPIPGSLEAIAQLNRHHFQVFIATNQSGIGRGYFDIVTLDLIHEKMAHELAAVGGYITEIFFCPHHPEENCSCRKPKPGLLQQIQQKYPITMTDTYFIGDTLGDIQVAQEMGCKPILILSDKGRLAVENNPFLLQIPNFYNLAAAVVYILETSTTRDKP